MTGSLQKRLSSHWARSVPDKRLALQLLRVTPFIFTASRSTTGSILYCDLEEPFAVLSTSSNQYPRIYDGSLWISANFMSYVRDPLPKCSRRIRVTEACFWLIRILSYSVKYLEDKKEHFALIESFSVIQEFHTNAAVFSQMIGVTKAINDTSKNQIRSHLPVGKKTISKKKCVGVTKKCDFPRLCSSISSTNLPQHCSPLQPSPEISLIVDSLPGVFAVEKPTNYVVTNSSTVTENKENISITKASTQNSISPLSIDPSSLFKDLFDCSDDCFTELKNLSNHFVSDETLTPVAKLPQDDNTHKTTSVIVLSEVPTFESEENKLYSSSTQYFSVQSENDSSSPKTPDSSVMEMNLNVKITDSLLESTCESCNNTDLPNLSVVPDTDKENMNGQCVDVTTNSTSPTLHKDSSIVNYVRDSVVQFVQGIKRKLSPRGSWVTPLTSRILKSSSENAPQSDAKRPRKSSPTHHPTTLTAKATTSSTSLLSLSLTSTNSSFSNLEYSSYTPDRFKYFSCNPVNPTRSLPIVRRWERQHNPLHEVVSFNNSSISQSLSSTESSCSITKSINKHQQLGKHERKIFKRYFYSINEIRRIPLNEDNYLELWKSFFS